MKDDLTKELETELEDFISLKHLLVLNVLFFLALKLVVPLSISQLAIISGPATSFSSREIITETNRARQAANLPPLAANAKLDIAAQKKLEDMVKNTYFAHVSPAGVSPWYWISNSGYQYSYAGENLALGYTTANDTVQGWLNSPGHRANVLNKNYKDIGVAVANATLQGVNGVLVVQTFGSQLIAPVAPKIQLSTAGAAAPTPPPVKSVVSGAVVEPPQEISTDKAVRLVTATEIVEKVTPEKGGLANNLNKGYVIYLSILTVGLILIGIIRGFRKMHLVSIGASFALLILMVTVPAMQAVIRSYIY